MIIKQLTFSFCFLVTVLMISVDLLRFRSSSGMTVLVVMMDKVGVLLALFFSGAIGFVFAYFSQYIPQSSQSTLLNTFLFLSKSEGDRLHILDSSVKQFMHWYDFL